jgi:hypothetical protein
VISNLEKESIFLREEICRRHTNKKKKFFFAGVFLALRSADDIKAKEHYTFCRVGRANTKKKKKWREKGVKV